MIGPLLDSARQQGELLAAAVGAQSREAASALLRSRLGLTGDPPPPCDDPELAYVDPASPVRSVHSDLGPMLIGGLASLLLQSLHPLAMAGVAQHSRFREDPLGRLERTATFVGTTTFRSTEEAEAAIAVVRRVHRAVAGTTADGVAYRASDPHLLRWVHVAEISSFLAAHDRYGASPLSAAEADRYVADMAGVAIALGADDVPTSRAELDACLEAYRPELRMTSDALEARRLVLLGVRRLPPEQLAHGLLAAAAVDLLAPWARRELGLPIVEPAAALSVRPLARLLCSGLRLVVPPIAAAS